MKNSEKGLLNAPFSHIYVEPGVRDHPRTLSILSRLSGACVIEADHYKDVFCRSGQDFALQKRSPGLVLASHRPPFLYEGSPRCHDFGHEHFYHVSSVMNCMFECEYCFLQAMYPSANVVIFVDTEQVFMELDRVLEDHSAFCSISYETDLLFFDYLGGFVDEWARYAGRHPGLTVEVRTKSANIHSLSSLKPVDNLVPAWTLSPDPVIRSYEKGTPGLRARLKAVKTAMDLGWKVRLCIDPVLFVRDWEAVYQELVESTFRHIPPDAVLDITVGTFRMGKEFLRRARKARPGSALLWYPFELDGDAYTYPADLRARLLSRVCEMLEKYVEPGRIYSS